MYNNNIKSIKYFDLSVKKPRNKLNDETSNNNQ